MNLAMVRPSAMIRRSESLFQHFLHHIALLHDVDGTAADIVQAVAHLHTAQRVHLDRRILVRGIHFRDGRTVGLDIQIRQDASVLCRRIGTEARISA